jgi:hypothetical protein
MKKKQSSALPTFFLGAFWFVLMINTTFNWGSTSTLFLWLLFTILIGWFVISIQNKVRKA